jgi:ABC-type proline/glycine betaine transport system ATPase subunit
VIATHNVDEGVELATEIAFLHRGRFVEVAPRGTRGPAQIADAYRRAVAGG